MQKSTWRHVRLPPAKIATPKFGSDVATRPRRATLRAAVLQAPDVTLKMSTAVEPLVPSAAQGMRLAHAISKPTSAHSSIPFPNPHNTTRKDTKINMATRTVATSEDRDSDIRQRCGCKFPSSYAESCSAPSSRRHVEDVHSVGGAAAVPCARHETCTRNQQKQPPPAQASHSPTRTTQHAKMQKSTWQHVRLPPAKIATPTFGSDVAARPVRATLRAAVLQAPDVTLKMSTTLSTTL
jgi:hypothetical protein